MENEENYRKQVLKTFFKNGQLLKIPTQNRKKDVVLQKVASRFTKDQEYTETQLDETLKKIYPDFEKLKILFLSSRFIKKINGAYHLV